jgi:hypothetical protein
MQKHRLDLWRVRALIHDRGLAASFSILGGWFVSPASIGGYSYVTRP